jgi:outer membrane protein OmpA-like peptidoglycan-associated protein
MNRKVYITRFAAILLVCFWQFSDPVLAQQSYTSKSKRAISFYEAGLKQYELFDFDKAIVNLEEATQADPQFMEAWLGLADVYDRTQNKTRVIECYKKAMAIKPSFFPNGYFNLGNALFSTGNYQEAIENYNLFLKYKSIEQRFMLSAMKRIESCKYALEAIKHPVSFNPVNLGDSVNTIYDDYWPSLSADEKTLVTTVRLPIDPLNPDAFRNRQEDFFISNKMPWGWSKSKSIGPPLNTDDNEGAQSLSADSRIMFFTACNRPDGKGQCDIYASVKNRDEWSPGVNLGSPVNSSHSEKQPSISPDGHVLYFASDRSGGKGGLDIWMSVLDQDGIWGAPINLGDSINTPGNEQSPFLHEDNQTLYFTSDGLIGMGGYDLYYSRRNPDSSWGKAVNLSYPINTSKDELGLIVNARANTAYYASNRQTDRGLDIYSFDLYPEARPVPVSYMKGTVYDSETNRKLAAHFELIDLESGKIINSSESSPSSGTFLVTIPANRDYALNVSRKDYLFFSANFSLKGMYEMGSPYLMDVPLKPIKAGARVVLNNIFFEFDSYRLKNESIVELNKLYDFLVSNPSLKIEIGGHTDNTGSIDYNQRLSDNRAKSVVDYLLGKGIDKPRLTSHGYGESQPVASNETEEGKALNRRTEFKIL